MSDFLSISRQYLLARAISSAVIELTGGWSTADEAYRRSWQLLHVHVELIRLLLAARNGRITSLLWVAIFSRIERLVHADCCLIVASVIL